MRFQPAKSFEDVLSFSLTGSMSKRINIMFKLFQSTEEEIEELTNDVNMYFLNYSNKIENHRLLFIELAHYLYVRPKSSKILLKIFLSIRINFIPIIDECIKFCYNNMQNPEMKALLYFIYDYRLFNIENLIHFIETKVVLKSPIEVLIQNDDIEKLQRHIQEIPNFNFSSRIKVTSTLMKKLCSDTEDISYLELSAFYGSLKCFRFFQQNIQTMPKTIYKYVVAGGNIEIFNILSHKDNTFKEYLHIAVFFHHYKMADLLLKDFSADPIPLDKCLNCYNEIAFLYFYSNLKMDTIDYEINSVIEKALYYTIDFPEIEIVKMLIDLKPVIEDSTLLIKECESPNITFEIFQLFVAYGMDVNEVIHGKTPLSALCSNKYANEHMVQYLIDFCADVNLCIPLNVAITSTNPYLAIIKLLIEKGAKLDPNSQKILPEELLTLAIFNYNITDEIIGYIFSLASEKYLSTHKYFCKLYMSETPNIIPRMKMLLKYGKNCNPKVFNPLHIICVQPVIKEYIINFLVDYGFKLTEYRQTTPFISLCQNAHVSPKFIEHLIDTGIDLNSIVDGTTIAYHICEHCTTSSDVIKLLVKKGKNVDFSNILYKLCDNNYYGFNHNKAIGVLNEILTIPPKLYGEIFYRYCESSYPSYDIVKQFISKGANVNQIIENQYPIINNKDPCIKTPFIAIIVNKKADNKIKELFLENSAAISIEEICNIAKYKSVNMDMVIFLMKLNNNLQQSHFFYNLCCNVKNSITLDIIKFVVSKGFPLNRGTNTPLSGLCKFNYNKEDIIKYIIERGADLNMGNYTPLFYLCRNIDASGINLIKYVIEKGADVNCGQYTPLYAIFDKYNFEREIFDLLINSGADPNAGKISAFSKLCKSRHLVKYLIELMFNHGAVMKPKGKDSPLLNTCQNKNLTCEILRLLLDKCKEEDYTDEIDEAMKCYLSCNYIQFDCIKTLIEYGANINENNPLFEICSRSMATVENIQWMIDKGADINDQNALFAVCYSDYPDKNVIKLLIDKGADINKIYEGQTPLEILMINKRNSLAEFLIQYSTK